MYVQDCLLCMCVKFSRHFALKNHGGSNCFMLPFLNGGFISKNKNMQFLQKKEVKVIFNASHRIIF